MRHVSIGMISNFPRFKKCQSITNFVIFEHKIAGFGSRAFFFRPQFFAPNSRVLNSLGLILGFLLRRPRGGHIFFWAGLKFGGGKALKCMFPFGAARSPHVAHGVCSPLDHPCILLFSDGKEVGRMPCPKRKTYTDIVNFVLDYRYRLEFMWPGRPWPLRPLQTSPCTILSGR